MAADTLRDEVRVQVSRFTCFYPCKKEARKFPLACFLPRCPDWGGGSSANWRKPCPYHRNRSWRWKRLVRLLSSFPWQCKSVLCLSLCFCCHGFFRSGMNRVFYLLINKKNLTLLWHSVFLATGNTISLPKFQCFVLHNGSFLGNCCLIYIRWALSICMVPITMVSEHQSDSFLFPSCMHSGLAWFMIVSCILNTYACVCGCVCLNGLQQFRELADFSLYQHFPAWDKTGFSISQIPS